MAASLPPEIVDLICKKVKLDADYVRFRSVCKSWRSVAPKRSTKSLFLIRHQSSNFMMGTKFFNRISFQTNEILPVRGPPKSSSPTSILNNEVVCIGSSLGWMALIHHLSKSVFLYNPITNRILNLPAFPKCSVHLTDRKCYERIDFILSSDPIVSPADCVALVMNDCSEKFIFYIIGSNSKTWTQFWFPDFYSEEKHLMEQWGKRACFCNGKLYLTMMGRLVESRNKLDDERKPCCKRIYFDYLLGKEVCNNDESYVVEKDGDVLLVLINWPRSMKEGYDIRLYKLFKERRMSFFGLEKWVDSLEKVESLGDKALFLSHKTSFCVTASDYSGCKENSVYYVARYSVGRKTTMKIRVRDLTDHSDVVLKDNVATSRRDWELCSWFVPSLQP